LVLNGRAVTLEVRPEALLLDVLRERLSLKGAKRSCDMQVCGACTVLVDGAPVSACTYLAIEADGHELTTVEGLAGSQDELHPVQQAFWENHGLQCGFCTPGILLTTYDFLRREHAPTACAIREALAGNICRCTGYENIVRAVQAADQGWER